MNRKWRLLLLAAYCMGFASCARAVTTVTVSGTVVMPPCQIVNIDGSLNPIAIDFGDMTIGDLDGTSYAQTVPWLLKCDDADELEKMYKLRINGTAIDFDTAAIVTTIPDVGIRFTFGSAPLPIGSDSDEFYKTGLLRVTPVKKAESKPAGGAFTASASLLLIIP